MFQITTTHAKEEKGRRGPTKCVQSRKVIQRPSPLLHVRCKIYPDPNREKLLRVCVNKL